MHLLTIVRKSSKKTIASLLLVITYAASLAGCALVPHSYFKINDGKVIFINLAGNFHQVKSADPLTFEHVGSIYGKDKQHVFYAYSIVDGADPASFIAIGENAGRDKKFVYIAGKRCTSCDLDSFRGLGGDWYTDKNTVYSRSTPLSEIDAKSVEWLNSTFVKDAQNVYANGSRIPGADPATFKLRSCGNCVVCGEDKNRCYADSRQVHCDCKERNSAPGFISGLTQIPPGKALVVVPFGPVDLAKTDAATHLRFGRWIVNPGINSLPLKCMNKRRGELTINIEADRVYRLKKTGVACELDIERPALVQGNEEGSILYFQMGDIKKAKSELLLPPGRQTLTVICRDVNRTRVSESSTEISMDLEAGRIYKLEPNYTPPNDKCDVRIIAR